MALQTDFLPGVNATLPAVEGGGPIVTLVSFSGRRIIKKMQLSIIISNITYGRVNLWFTVNGDTYGGDNLRNEQLLNELSRLGATETINNSTSTISFTIENAIVDGFEMTIQNPRVTADNAILYRLSVSSSVQSLREVL